MQYEICIHICVKTKLKKFAIGYIFNYKPEPRLNVKTVFPRYGIPVLKIRRPRDRLIFNVGIPIRVMLRRPPGLFLLSEKLSYCKTSRNYSEIGPDDGIALKFNRSNFRAIWQPSIHISRLQDFKRSSDTMSYGFVYMFCLHYGDWRLNAKL